MKTSETDIKKLVRFNTVVQNVQYVDAADNFIVTINNLATNLAHVETFTHIIVAVGIFNVPNMPSFPGIETFEGCVLHVHNFRDARQFKGQRLLLIGSHYSAEDLALQCLKFGAKNVVCTWRTKPMGFTWPKGITERPLVQKFVRNTAHFKDGTSEEFDSIILCTGYLYRFPFMEDRLRLKSECSFYPDNLYKGTLWMRGGNNKVLYLGTQDQYFSFTLFDVEALWACR
jgi:trimethylamine monooxygenase